MGSLDVDSLFTNIPLEETNDICPNTLFENTEGVKVLSKKNKIKNFYRLLQKNPILFLMGSSTNKLMELLLGLALAIYFSCIH